VATLRPPSIDATHGQQGEKMNIARLGAAGAAAGIVTLCAAGPAFATGTPAPVPGGAVSKATPSAPTTKAPGLEPSADVSPKFFYGGDTLTFTVKNCAVQPTVVDLNHLFLTTHPFASTGKGEYAAKETVRKDLIEGHQYKVAVHCGRWTDTFTTKPHKKPTPTPTPTASQPTGVPSGAPQTGDGSSSGGGNAGLIAGGAGVVLAGLAGGTFLYTRRRSSAGA
jgi:hypothetical protein